jgi:hypothetical protein
MWVHCGIFKDSMYQIYHIELTFPALSDQIYLVKFIKESHNLDI